MKKFLAFSLLLAACSSDRDEQFCRCMNVSEEYSDLRRKEFDDPASVDKKTLEKGLKMKEKACVDYELMAGEEMLKRKAACAE